MIKEERKSGKLGLKGKKGKELQSTAGSLRGIMTVILQSNMTHTQLKQLDLMKGAGHRVTAYIATRPHGNRPN